MFGSMFINELAIYKTISDYLLKPLKNPNFSPQAGQVKKVGVCNV
jgi:hypothetical protein